LTARQNGVQINEGGDIEPDSTHRRAIPGIHSAYNVESWYKQIAIASGQGTEAAMMIFEDLINLY
jgi:alkyl hydroperoxide reductase subunit AhpF